MINHLQSNHCNFVQWPSNATAVERVQLQELKTKKYSQNFNFLRDAQNSILLLNQLIPSVIVVCVIDLDACSPVPAVFTELMKNWYIVSRWLKVPQS